MSNMNDYKENLDDIFNIETNHLTSTLNAILWLDKIIKSIDNQEQQYL